MKCCKASQFSNDAGARIWQAADVGYLALQYGAWLTWACLTLQLSSHLVPLLLQESSHLVPLLLQESSHLVPLLLQESSHLVPLLLQESSLHFLSFFVKTFLVYFLREIGLPRDYQQFKLNAVEVSTNILVKRSV